MVSEVRAFGASAPQRSHTGMSVGRRSAILRRRRKQPDTPGGQQAWEGAWGPLVCQGCRCRAMSARSTPKRGNNSLFGGIEPSLRSSSSRLFDTSHNASSAYIKQHRPVAQRVSTSVEDPPEASFVPTESLSSVATDAPLASKVLPTKVPDLLGSRRWGGNENVALDGAAEVNRRFQALEAAIAVMNQPQMYSEVKELRQAVAMAPTIQQRGDGPTVTVYGFSATDRDRVMHKFSSFGDVEEHKFAGNWVQIRYRDKAQAAHALGRAGSMGYVHIGRDLLVGVAPGQVSSNGVSAETAGDGEHLGPEPLAGDSAPYPIPFRQNKRPRLDPTEAPDGPRPATGGGWKGWGASVAEYLLGP